MARPKRQKIKADLESFNKLLQEAYNQMDVVRATATRFRTKLEAMSDGDPIMLLQASKEIVGMARIEAETISKKLQMSKIISDYTLGVSKIDKDEEIKKSKIKSNTDEKESGPMTPEKRKELNKVFAEMKKNSFAMEKMEDDFSSDSNNN